MIPPLVFLLASGLFSFIPSIFCHQHDFLWCDSLASQVQKAEESVSSHLPPDVAGKWVSENCEIRPGPEFVLRLYQFNPNLSFRLIQFYYGDSSCSLPLYAVSAWGRLRWARPSWLVLGAQETDYTLTKVAVYAYSTELAEALSARINSSCSGHVTRQWRPFRSYVIYNAPETKGNNEATFADDFDCLSGLHLVFHELQLVRVEKRQNPHHRHSPGMRSELLLGDIHTRLEERPYYRPTSYQPPLLNANEMTGCYVCRLVSRADERTPPHLHAVAQLPVHLVGEWVSQRCETRPLGMFVIRRVRFFGRMWQGVYQFHADPACSVATLNVIASGDFAARGPSLIVHGGWDYDFRVTGITLTPLDIGTVHNLNGHPNNTCGTNGSWQLGEPQDVTATHGCSSLGIKVPSVHYELVKMGIDHHGNGLLYLGLPDTSMRRYTPTDRPTAYQPPLVQCQMFQPRVPMPNDLGPVPNAIYSEPLNLATTTTTSCHLFAIILLLTSLSITFTMSTASLFYKITT